MILSKYFIYKFRSLHILVCIYECKKASYTYIHTYTQTHKYTHIYIKKASLTNVLILWAQTYFGIK